MDSSLTPDSESIRVQGMLPSNKEATPCMICSGPLPTGEVPFDPDEIDLHILKYGVNYEDLCDRCDLMKRITDHCVDARILIADEMDGDQAIAVEWMAPRTWKWFQWWEKTQRTNFEVFVLPSSPKPFAEFPVKELVVVDTASKDSLERVKGYIRTCVEDHELCRPGADEIALPTRLVDVSGGKVRLHETNGAQGRYACLSHCWGDSRPLCRTTYATLDANHENVPWESMPATFRDAIDFTRRLGLDYIWIDSMCIVQDNLDDWAIESSLMANIYENAYVTICATRAASDDVGCYSTTPTEFYAKEISIQDRYGIEYTIFIALDMQVSRMHLPHWQVVDHNPHPQYFPLMIRAWVYQERLLSSRLVHFTTTEIIWECAEITACSCLEPSPLEDFNNGTSAKEQHRRKLMGESTSTQAHWSTVVINYSRLRLTFEKDKLPALSGIAAQTMRIREGDTYLAGLWKNTLLHDLCWSTLDAYERPVAYRAPSWSWASLDGNMSFFEDDFDAVKIHVYSTIISAHTTPATSDPFGQVSHGSVTISGPVVEVHLEIADRHLELAAGSHKEWFFQDCRGDMSAGRYSVGEKLLVLRLAASRYGDFNLVLRKTVDVERTAYQRVGYLRALTESMNKHWFSPGSTDTVVEII